MARARAECSINTEALAEFIHEGAGNVMQRRDAWKRVEEILGTSDNQRIPAQYAHTSREDLYLEGLRLGKAACDDMVDFDHNLFDYITPRYQLSNYSPFGLTGLLFKPSIRLMGNEEQQKFWLPLAERGVINGAYLQTELGHGTFVRGLETTATFHEKHDSFVIHTPTLTSTKFWPGSLAFTATHGIVLARLIIFEKDHGVHPFIVKLREEDGSVVTGVEVGDIGPKPSYNQNDNGFANFRHVHVPREHMLMGQATVDRHGNFTKMTHSKSTYAAMMAGRSKIVWVASLQLAQAVTIAIRYSTVREQGYPTYGSESTEVTLMSYRTQKYRLLSSLANAFAMLFAARRCRRAQEDFELRKTSRDFSTMTAVHALSAGTKAWATSVAFVGAADARSACGGHGYSAMSGLPDIVSAIDALCTLEGDNVVLWLQTARYLMKIYRGVVETGIGGGATAVFQDSHAAAPLHQDVQYLSLIGVDKRKPGTDELIQPHVQLEMFQHRARSLLRKTFDAFERSRKTKPDVVAWDEHMLGLIDLAQAHITCVVLEEFQSQLSTVEDVRNRTVLGKLCSLFALSQMAMPVSAYDTRLRATPILYEIPVGDVEGHINAALDDLAPEAIALTDAWDFTDGSLASALGARDGNVYERLMVWTRQLPTNIDARKGDGQHVNRWNNSIRPALRPRL